MRIALRKISNNLERIQFIGFFQATLTPVIHAPQLSVFCFPAAGFQSYT